MITANINATRAIVSGSPALGGSLKFENHIVPEQLQTAYEVGGFRVVTPENPPGAINLRVGGVVTLDELTESDRTDALVVPLMEGTSDGISLKSIAAAQLGIDVLKVQGKRAQLPSGVRPHRLQAPRADAAHEHKLRAALGGGDASLLNKKGGKRNPALGRSPPY